MRISKASLVAVVIFFLLVLAHPAQVVSQEPASVPGPPDDAPAAAFPLSAPSLLKRAAPRPVVLKTPPAIGNKTWVAQGPGPALSGQVEGLAGGEVVGAIHTVAAHPSDPDVLYAGGANGGVWKSVDATAVSPSWTPLTDFEASLSIGALEFDPTDLTHATLVAGIGLYSSFSSLGGARTGLLKTVDGGTTWSALSGGGALSGVNVSGVAPRGTTLVASSNFATPFLCSLIGIWRSTDGGTTFSNVTPASVPPGPLGVAFDLASDPASPATLYTGLTFVGSTCSPASGFTNGVYKSLDTGLTWFKVSSAAMDALIVDGITNNIEIAADGLDVYVNIVQSGRPAGIFHSGDGGGSWTALDVPRTPEGVPLAIAVLSPGAPIVVDTTPTPHGLSSGMEAEIAGVAGTAGANGVWTISSLSTFTFFLSGSTDFTPWAPATGTWVKVVGLNPREKPGSQGGIHASIRPDPVTPSIVYLGGDRQDFPFPNFLGALDFSGRLFRGDTTVAASGAIPSPQWEHLTHSAAVGAIPGGGTLSSSAPHADSREMVFDASGDLIEVDDGGIYRRTSPAANTGDWFSINGDIQVTEQHDVAYDAISDILISGNQDTGTTQQTSPGSLVWDSVHTADGGDVQVDDTTVAGVSTRFSSFQLLGSFRRREYDATNALLSQVFATLVTTPPDDSLIANFVTPVELNAVTPTRLVIGGCNSVYESLDQGDTLVQVPGLLDFGCGSGGIFSFPQNAIAYGGISDAVPNPDVLYVGSLTDVYVRTAVHPAPLVSAATYPGTSTVRDVVLDPSDWMAAFVVDTTKVYRTTDAGATWTDVTGNLTDPGLQSTAYISGNPDVLVVGGRDGVFRLRLPAVAPFTWGELGGLPNAPVWDLEYDAADDVLVAGTLGRGAWKLENRLFSDGFESGDTTAWSSKVP